MVGVKHLELRVWRLSAKCGLMPSRFSGLEELVDLFERREGRAIASQEEDHYLWLMIERR